jgi:hypothetical protein
MKTKAHFFPDLNMATVLDPADPLDKNYSATKVLATIGPASKDVDTLVQMLDSGMSAAR